VIFRDKKEKPSGAKKRLPGTPRTRDASGRLLLVFCVALIGPLLLDILRSEGDRAL